MKIDVEYQVIQIRFHTWVVLNSFECFGPCHGLITLLTSLRSRRLEVVGTRKNGRTPCVSPSRAPVLSFARYFQAPATQATY